MEPGLILQRLRDLPNAGREHLFLGDPSSDGCDKTTVEPGNVYSPGVWTCGVSVCVAVGEELFSPLAVPQEAMDWRFGEEEGFAPVLRASYAAGKGVAITHRLCQLSGEGSEGIDFNEVLVQADAPADALVAIVVRDIGPAGGAVRRMEWHADTRTLTLNDALQLVVDTPVDGCAIAGKDGSHESPAAIITKAVSLSQPFSLRFRTLHNNLGRTLSEAIPRTNRHAKLTTNRALGQAAAAWRRQVPAQVFCPDARVSRAWNASCHHILAAMECRLPRIGAVNYPIFWMRDGVIILRALDMMGRPDLARSGADYLAPLMFSGGFGAESDAPGEAVWALVSHALITRDVKWLKSIFPTIEKRASLIRTMLATRKPLRAMTENRMPDMMHVPGSSVYCFCSSNGLIHGRMDWHTPDFFINCWTHAGLRLAAEAARLTGHRHEAKQWATAAARLDKALAAHLLPTYGNDRDPIITPYPSGALAQSRGELTQAFGKWFRSHRLDAQGERKPEPDWTYFEAAQIHNAFLLGFHKEAWTCLDGMLRQPSGRDVHVYTEGPAGGNEYLIFHNDKDRRGWLDRKASRGGNMPHNWTSGEMVNLIRDMFVREEGDALVLGTGAPAAWRKPGCSFGVRGMPTNLGPVSYTVSFSAGGKARLRYKGPKKYRLAWE